MFDDFGCFWGVDLGRLLTDFGTSEAGFGFSGSDLLFSDIQIIMLDTFFLPISDACLVVWFLSCSLFLVL